MIGNRSTAEKDLQAVSRHYADHSLIHPKLTVTFGDPVWNLRKAVACASTPDSSAKLDFSLWDAGIPRRTVFLKEFAVNCMSYNLRGSGTPLRLIAPSAVATSIRCAAQFLAFVEDVLGKRIAEVMKADAQLFVKKFVDKEVSAEHLTKIVGVIRRIAFYADRTTEKVFQGDPFCGASVKTITGVAVQEKAENETLRIPEQVIGPLLKWALFYMDQVAPDILRATQEESQRESALTAWDQNRTGERGEVKRKVRIIIDEDLARRERAEIPLPQVLERWNNGSVTLGGVSCRAYARILGIPERDLFRQQEVIHAAVTERKLALTSNHYDVAPACVPGSRTPWTTALDRNVLWQSLKFVQIACYIVIAYFTGMRDGEVQSLRAGCVERVVDPVTKRVTRYRIHGETTKANGGEAQPKVWVTIAVAARAVEVLESIVRAFELGPELFGKVSHNREGTIQALKGRVNLYLNRFMVACNALAEKMMQDAGTDTERKAAQDMMFTVKWHLLSRQFRRTIAWYIANRPFGTVAGMIQYGHLSHITFEGYAGTSASGFRAEVEREQALARLGDIVELYADHKRGVLPAGGRAGTLTAEFEHVERVLEQDGAEVVDDRRLKRMLANLAVHLYPGVYSHCFFNADTALCLARSERKDQPILANCDELACANACRWKVHAPAIQDAIEEIRELRAGRGMSPTQRTILDDQSRRFQALLTPVAGYQP